MSSLDPSRTVRELRELAELTSNERGAQRVAWSPVWTQARAWMRERLLDLGADVEVDEAGNQWATLEGRSPDAVLIGGHIDSVVDGGWLDGSLDLLAGMEVLRRVANQGRPPRTLRLVDWADEEGVRFGLSLFGSSAASGSLEVAEAARLLDREGQTLREVLAEHGIGLERALDCHRQLQDAVAYLELHIEQGPVLEDAGLPLAVVQGTFGAERHKIQIVGQASHAGSTPMDLRRDALTAASRLVLAVREIAKQTGGVGTVGSMTVRPGIVNAVAGACRLTLDQRHLDAAALAQMLSEAQAASERIANDEGVEITWQRLWHIRPLTFAPRLIELAHRAVEEVAGVSHEMASGPLHDASEMAAAGIPTVMLFVQSLRGLSHTPEEDTRPEHIELSVRALDRLTTAAMVASLS